LGWPRIEVATDRPVDVARLVVRRGNDSDVI
jgi:hypothetical protein